MKLLIKLINCNNLEGLERKYDVKQNGEHIIV